MNEGNDDIERADPSWRETPFLNTEQAAFYLRISPRHLQRLRAKGDGPPFRRHLRYVLYHLKELEIWSRKRTKGPTKRSCRKKSQVRKPSHG